MKRQNHFQDVIFSDASRLISCTKTFSITQWDENVKIDIERAFFVSIHEIKFHTSQLIFFFVCFPFWKCDTETCFEREVNGLNECKLSGKMKFTDVNVMEIFIAQLPILDLKKLFTGHNIIMSFSSISFLCIVTRKTFGKANNFRTKTK